MPVNLSFPELKETKAQSLPPASLETLKTLRNETCTQSKSADFKLQPHQRFLRRVLSPDSPVRNLLMAHGTGSGKTCASIQIAEEYIIRPEFQDKRVLVLANPAVQENFKSSIFNMSRVVVDQSGILASKQCTGRRYLDMLTRIQTEPLKWTDKRVRDQLQGVSQKIISDFYEFKGYLTFANEIDNQKLLGGLDSWIHKTFDNRMIIVDEAHALKDATEGKSGKLVSMALEQVVKIADNVTLILLTATPMFDTYSEIMTYFNLFLWNDRRLGKRETVQTSSIFNKAGGFLNAEAERTFRGWCQDYISFVRGDNPLTFPFRLPPPDDLIASPEIERDSKNKVILPENRRKYLPLTHSVLQGEQLEAFQNDNADIQPGVSDPRVICVLPEGRDLSHTFTSGGENGTFAYTQDIPKFLSPSLVGNYSSKFALINKIIKESVGVCFVYSNLVPRGAQLFAMCLEEHGFESATGNRLLANTSNEINRGSNGKYVLLSDITDSDLKRILDRLQRPENLAGEDIRIIVASPRTAEGVDLRYVRQVHVLDPWFNMSKMEQIVGRGIRTCSHELLPFEHQNCTVYYHICRLPESIREIRDETIYRVFVEEKAVAIAKVKQALMESAMDCPLQEEANRLPADWRGLLVTQTRSQRNESVQLRLEQMTSQTFGVNLESLTCKVITLPEDPEHTRPLSAILDVKDEIFDKLLKLFARKSVWTKEEIYKSPELRSYDKEIVVFMLQDAVETGFKVKNRNGKVGNIESRENMYAFGTGTLQTRFLPEESTKIILLPKLEEVKTEHPPAVDISQIRNTYEWVVDARERFSTEVLDWYIVDHVLSAEERLKHMLGLDWTNPPIYAKNLHINGLYLLGSSQIYDSNFNLTTPIGEEADAVHKWVEQRKQLYIDTRSQFFATMKEGAILFNLDDKADSLKTANRSKNIGGRACTSYPESLLNKFSEWLVGSPFPEPVKTKLQRCQYISLMIRDAIIKQKTGIVWWTPEEWLFFSEETNRKDLLSRIKYD